MAAAAGVWRIKPAAWSDAIAGRRSTWRRHHLGEQRVIELRTDHGRHPHDVERLGRQIVEPGAYHGLDGVGQHQGALVPLDARVAFAHGQRVLFEKRRAHLFEEERIAASTVVHALRQRVGDLASAENGGHDGHGGLEIQPPQMEPRRVCGPSVRRASLARGDDQHERRRVRQFRNAEQSGT